MSFDLDQFPFGQIANWLAQGQVVPFLGSAASSAGVSGPDRLPIGRELAAELVKAMGPAYPGQTGDELAKVAQYYERPFIDRAALYDYLQGRFFKKLVYDPLPPVAELLANLPSSDAHRFIVTTNYDVLIERAFKKAGRPLCVITQNMRDPVNGATQVNLVLPDGKPANQPAKEFILDDPSFPKGTTYLFKMHGSAHHDTNGGSDDLIITEDDYVDFLVNTGGVVSPNFPPACLATAFKTKRFLFLGYSLEDWNFRAFLRLLALRNALSKADQLRHFAIQLKPSALDVALWGERNVKVFDGDLVEFCSRLKKKWP